MKKSVGVIVTVCVIATALVAFVAVYASINKKEQYRRTPEYSMTQLRKAIKSHDLVSFEQYVDVDGLVDGLVDQVWAVNRLKRNAADKRDLLTELMDDELLSVSREQVADAARCQLVGYVESGRFERDKAGSDCERAEQFLSKIWNEAIAGYAKFRDIEYVQKQNGGLARVGLGVELDRSDRGFVLDLLMKDRGEYWQVTSLNNFPEFVRELIELRNARVREEMNQTLVLANIDKSATNGLWGIGKKVIIELKLENQGQKQIALCSVDVVCKSSDGKELDSFTVTSSRGISPGDAGKGFWYKDINSLSSDDRMLYETEQSDLRIDASVKSILFADKSRLELWGDREIM